jgi:hypothetical protein
VWKVNEMKGRHINGKGMVNGLTTVELAVRRRQTSMAIIGIQDKHFSKTDLLLTKANAYWDEFRINQSWYISF